MIHGAVSEEGPHEHSDFMNLDDEGSYAHILSSMMDDVPQDFLRDAANATPATLSSSADSIPEMPRTPSSDWSGGSRVPHRLKIPCVFPAWYALVARPVNRTERRANEKAQAAMLKEWSRLRNVRCWDEACVREWKDVKREANYKGIIIHIGRIFDICVKKGSGLASRNPLRTFKGRVGFQGNMVFD